MTDKNLLDFYRFVNILYIKEKYLKNKDLKCDMFIVYIIAGNIVQSGIK